MFKHFKLYWWKGYQRRQINYQLWNVIHVDSFIDHHYLLFKWSERIMNHKVFYAPVNVSFFKNCLVLQVELQKISFYRYFFQFQLSSFLCSAIIIFMYLKKLVSSSIFFSEIWYQRTFIRSDICLLSLFLCFLIS